MNKKNENMYNIYLVDDSVERNGNMCHIVVEYMLEALRASLVYMVCELQNVDMIVFSHIWSWLI